MLKRFASFCVALLFTICSITCGGISASAIWTVDDGTIDPWGDLDSLQQQPPDFEIPEAPAEDISGEDSTDWALQPTTVPLSLSVSSGAYVTYPTNQNAGTATVNIPAKTAEFATNAQSNALIVFNQTLLPSYYQWGFIKLYTSDATFDVTVPLESVIEAPGNETGTLTVKLNTYLTLDIEGKQAYSLPTSCNLIVNGKTVLGDTTVTGTSTDSVLTATFQVSAADINNANTISLQLLFASETIPNVQISSGSSFNTIVRWHMYASSIDWVYEQSTSGLLGGITDWIKSIYETIVGLPSAIADTILSGLQALFVPSETEMQELSNKYNSLFESKLGFLYQMLSKIVDAFNNLVQAMQNAQDYTFVFPGIKIPYNGDYLVIIGETNVSLENDVMAVLRPIVGTAISIIAVLATVSTGFDMVVAVMSGTSYFDFLKGKKGGQS